MVTFSEKLEEEKCEALLNSIDNLRYELSKSKVELRNIYKMLTETKKCLEFYAGSNFSVDMEVIKEWKDGRTACNMGTKARETLDYIEKNWKNHELY